MLTQKEMELLQKECEGHTVGFSVFCREKLLNREAFTLSKPLDKEVRIQLTNLLKFSGSLLLLAQKTKNNDAVSEDFRLMASQVKGIVQRAHFAVNEITYSQCLVLEVDTVVKKMDKITRSLYQKWPGEENIAELAELLNQLLDSLQAFMNRYFMKPSSHDR